MNCIGRLHTGRCSSSTCESMHAVIIHDATVRRGWRKSSEMRTTHNIGYHESQVIQVYGQHKVPCHSRTASPCRQGRTAVNCPFASKHKQVTGRLMLLRTCAKSLGTVPVAFRVLASRQQGWKTTPCAAKTTTPDGRVAVRLLFVTKLARCT
jgi:hypothetical protein